MLFWKLQKRISFYFLWLFVFLSCGKTAPLWIGSEQFIDTAQQGGFIVEVVSLYPSKTLAQLKCETQGKLKLKSVIQAEIEDIFRNISFGEEDVRKDFLRKLSENMAKEFSFKAEMVDSYADEVNQVLYCKIFLKFDENFYKALIEESEKLMKEHFSQIYDEGLREKIKREIHLKRRVKLD